MTSDLFLAILAMDFYNEWQMYMKPPIDPSA